MLDHLDTLRSVAPWWREYVRREAQPGKSMRELMRYLEDRQYQVMQHVKPYLADDSTHFPGPFDLIDKDESTH